MLTNIISFNMKTESLANLYTSLAAASTRSHTVRNILYFIYLDDAVLVGRGYNCYVSSIAGG